MNYKAAMLGNKVSPASLCSSEPSLPSHPSEGMLGEESQPSQASLFSGEANSMELFSQSQGHSGCCGASQDDGRAVLATRTATLGSALPYSQGSQGSSGRKYYMKYLSSTALSAGKPEGNTPLVNDGRVGGTACSRAAFETWKSKQQDRLENKQIIDGVIQTTKDIARELSQTLESLRAEVKEATSSPKQKEGTPHNMAEPTDPQLRILLVQLLQGQAGIRQEVTGIGREVAGIKKEVTGIGREVSLLQRQQTLLQDQLQSLVTQVSAVVDGPLTALPSALQEQRGASDALRQSLEGCVARIEALAERTVEPHSKIAMLVEPHSKTARTGGSSGGGTEGADLGGGDLSNGLGPCDRAVPTSSRACEPFTTSDSLYDDSSAGKRPHLGEKRPRTMEDYSSVERASPELPMAPITRTSRAEPPPASQGSSSTLYDIDLTQESPSLCSQIISQHLQQCSGGGRAGVLGGRRLGRSGPLDPATPGRKKKKTTELARGRGGRRGRTRQGAVTRTPVPRRRSQRLHEFSRTPLGSVRAGGGRQQLRRVKQRAGGREGAQESPVNALSDAFYTQSQAARPQPPAVAPGDSTGLDWSQEGPTQPAVICSTTAAERVQRSSEAARRRLAISHRMMAGMLDSDPVLQEISASLRSQRLPERPANTNKTNSSFMV